MRLRCGSTSDDTLNHNQRELIQKNVCLFFIYSYIIFEYIYNITEQL